MILRPRFSLSFFLTIIELTILLLIVVVNYTTGGPTVIVALILFLAIMGHLVSRIDTLHIVYIMELVLGD